LLVCLIGLTRIQMARGASYSLRRQKNTRKSEIDHKTGKKGHYARVANGTEPLAGAASLLRLGFWRYGRCGVGEFLLFEFFRFLPAAEVFAPLVIFAVLLNALIARLSTGRAAVRIVRANAQVVFEHFASRLKARFTFARKRIAFVVLILQTHDTAVITGPRFHDRTTARAFGSAFNADAFGQLTGRLTHSLLKARNTSHSDVFAVGFHRSDLRGLCCLRCDLSRVGRFPRGVILLTFVAEHCRSVARAAAVLRATSSVAARAGFLIPDTRRSAGSIALRLGGNARLTGRIARGTIDVTDQVGSLQRTESIHLKRGSAQRHADGDGHNNDELH